MELEIEIERGTSSWCGFYSNIGDCLRCVRLWAYWAFRRTLTCPCLQTWSVGFVPRCFHGFPGISKRPVCATKKTALREIWRLGVSGGPEKCIRRSFSRGVQIWGQKWCKNIKNSQIFQIQEIWKKTKNWRISKFWKFPKFSMYITRCCFFFSRTPVSPQCFRNLPQAALSV